ncbi:MAG: TonB-dependent receptor plug domain-containing protein [Bacteroidales bacterium]|nr:TonB-dependent receptor plug domain-containing protein [Bacteroidales bacterium]MBO4566814.1 TonB-dependent receptor plug domain-containing protein [Bacteroidales bacterium]
MKHIFTLIVILLAAASCASQRIPPESTKDPSEVNSRARLNPGQNELSGYTSVYEYLRGKVPGLIVEGTDVYIRGISTVNSGTAPMFIVDGVEVQDISNVRPQEIVGVEVIKDASASIYGFRAANGVIKISTNRGYNKD